MKFIHSFRTRLFTGFLAASLVPVLVCSSMLLQIFRLRLDSQVDEESQEYLSQVTESLDGLYTGFRQTMLALRASPYVAPALAREQTKSSRVYSELYSATEGSRSGAQFDLYDSQGTWLYLFFPRWTAVKGIQPFCFGAPHRSRSPAVRRQAIS